MVSLFNGLLQLELFSFFFLITFFAAPLKFFGRKFEVKQMFLHACQRHFEGTLAKTAKGKRLKHSEMLTFY